MTQETAMPENSAAEKTTEEQLEEKLERYLVLKKQNSEYEKLKKELKPLFEGTASIKVGRFHVTGKWVSRAEVIQPACKYWNMTVKPAVEFELKIGDVTTNELA
jgi:hypothetical protein